MIFSNITIHNFKQYYNTVSVDLKTTEERNIVLFGGNNGYGKTNFLLAIVWCLYGDKIAQIDENFKKEIQKEKNYASFIQQSLNWTAKKEGANEFFISILIEEIELPEITNLFNNSSSILIKRSRNIETNIEYLSILDASSGIELFDDETDKLNFINDYIIPIDAAKFVFFDAEKIADMANLPIKEEGSFINDALCKILGLDIYETLIEDLDIYINTLKKEGASKDLQDQIIDKEHTIELSNIKINALEEENAGLQKDIDTLKKEIRKYDNLISQNTKHSNIHVDRKSLIREIENIDLQCAKITESFSEMSEILPLAILTGKLEEIKEHLEIQSYNEIASKTSKENLSKIENFIELLFNRPPEPEDSSMSFKDKAFYYQKAMRLSSELYPQQDDNYKELAFEHDLTNADKQLIYGAINTIQSYSAEQFKSTTDNLNLLNAKRNELNTILSKAEAALEDELVLSYIAEKDTAHHTIDSINRKIGENIQQISKCKEKISQANQQLITLRSKVDMNEQNKLRINEAQKFIDVLNTFIEEQKHKHKESLEITILSELKTLMHKLASRDNQNKLIENVEVTILAGKQGMKVSLLDQDDNEIRKESLSSGEKQIYISCLIKAILKESIQNLPIFIDTPLGRLDEEHRSTIIKQYYPSLSQQVVLFSTNSEITPKRIHEIEQNIAHTYILQNNGRDTQITSGYF